MTKSVTRSDSKPLIIDQRATNNQAALPKWLDSAIEAISLSWRYIRYVFSFAYTRSITLIAPNKYPWWNEITGEDTKKIGNIILGALPKKSDINKLNDIEVTAVLSLNEPFEREKSIICEPATSKDWEEQKIINLLLMAEDFNPVSQENIKKGVKFLESRKNQEGKTYIHCKAGRGRSATVLICHIMKQLNLTPDEAIAYVKKYRPVISINKRQKPAIEEYHKFLVRSFLERTFFSKIISFIRSHLRSVISS